jgi:transcriptional regulator with XRE-family HTH domain
MSLLSAMDVRQTIGWNLRRIRVEKGLSQERLALEASIDRAYVGRVERGQENVTVSTLEALSNALHVHVSEFFAEVEDGAKWPSALPSGRRPKSD